MTGKKPNGFEPTERTRIKRSPARASYDRHTVHAILDAGLVCHVGYTFDGHPYVTTTAYWREHDRVYWHGSAASRMLRQQSERVPVCFTVAHLDGLVMARSAFHHSVNYRSVMAFGLSEPTWTKTRSAGSSGCSWSGWRPGAGARCGNRAGASSG